ncbi:hypothetical protein G7068_01065 [Leucobacter viscericola]|uniref:Uncharacterized protein n=1 Tax=Leucobacter viscericola TaxID=2714935 RepID=A0A6G7XBS6_9MICO|nr:leucine-rich repeat domain-containing protein [Leucobacter viscericola]QIK61952.1 hypothetical protein G7068_01065 [Leucobacter viscericola]
MKIMEGMQLKPLRTFASAALAVAVLSVGVIGGTTAAQAAPNDEVSFADAGLKACVAKALGAPVLDPITEEQLNSLTGTLDCAEGGIDDVTPLQFAKSITGLNLGNNELADISPLAGLTNLTVLELDHNQIVDASPVAGLTNLSSLDLVFNQITDLSSLTGLTNIKYLYLDGNHAPDLTPLAGLDTLVTLTLGGNGITDLSPLAGLRNLDWLDLYVNKVTDLSPLSGLSKLRFLELTHNDVSDVSPLAALPVISTIEIGDNHVADISPLAGLETLQSVYLVGQTLPAQAAIVGVPSAVPTVTILDGSVAPLTVGNGAGSVAGGAVTWSVAGDGTLVWSQKVTVGPSTSNFSGTVPYTATEAAAAPLLSGSPTAGVVGSDYSYSFDVSGPPMPTVSVTAGALPDGLTLSTDGVLSGTPTAPGTYTFTLTASNGTAPDAVLEVKLVITAAADPADTPKAPVTQEAPVVKPGSAPQTLAVTGADPVFGWLASGALGLLAGGAMLFIARRRLSH